MKLDRSLKFTANGLNCEYRSLSERDVTNEYVNGVRQQTRYLKYIPTDVSADTQRQYIYEKRISPNDSINGFFVNTRLIGTAGTQLSSNYLGYTNTSVDSVTTIGIFIFCPRWRRLGLGAILVWATTYLLHHCAGKEWFGAGMEKENIPSLKSFLSCGYEQVYEDDDNYRVLLNFQNLIKPKLITNESICYDQTRDTS